ncbi:hypothetical protein INT47_002500 [Mucor saturninus]|uniref:Disease resistance R13L4/SHOC-2-like LRR domain-containing protein n=1 Tax=Mucor saturninus TaxID=64648 RepID=A0A8H7RH85_9FUNG|nr:hypothetical protein INT47_002500 [Mucor saturninus]
MGQQSSREHAPLTFGYVGQSSNELNQQQQQQQDQDRKDFVLSNPHLYQLQAVCKQCNSTEDELVVSTIIGESCSKCQKQKRLSLVRKDLADDLQYIDETYYPDLIHYDSKADDMEIELLQLENDNTSQVLTIGEVTHNTPGRPRRLTGPSMAIDLSNRSLVKLSPSIGYLDGLTKLDLSNNQMKSLPREIGYLKNLSVLNVSDNLIEEIPDTIAFLSKLKALNVSDNNLVQLPAAIGSLHKLVIIIANNNSLKSLPREFKNLVNLISLNVSNNPLKSLPAEIANLKSLRKLLTDDCPFEEEYSYNLVHNPPSLFETCARIAIKSQTNITSQLADHIKEYLSRADKCSYCSGPFFESYVTRARFIERRARQYMALEYTLCSAHWSNENDRLLAMFAEQPVTTKRHQIDMDGLNEDIITATRNRAYSDLTPSSPSSHVTNDYFPISLLKSPPNLPVLQQESSLQSPRGNRPRASSTASVTKRFTNFMRSGSGGGSSTPRNRSHSGSSTSSLSSTVAPPTPPPKSNLREWTSNQVPLPLEI